MRSRCISILGSTGSIGKNTLNVVRHLGNLRVSALAAGRNVSLLAAQIEEFRPHIAACDDEFCAEKLERELFALGIKGGDLPRLVFGSEGLVLTSTEDESDTLVSATVGAVGFVPTLRAIEAGKRIALANKETLVIAGELMTNAARTSNSEILPVDSEHNALHQCLRGERKSEVKRLILTASGGPFRTKSREEIENATIEQALDHPTWNMGDKITIDSATLMNKGLEVIEAHWLFGMEADDIDIVIHPQSLVHSMIELVDGSIIAQLGVTDMKHAIQYALTYPERLGNQLPALDFATNTEITFEEPDYEKFPNPAIAYRALKKGGTAPAVLNASNEVAVSAFLEGKIRLSEIAKINSRAVDLHTPDEADTIEKILQADRDARVVAEKMIGKPAPTAASGN